MIKTIHNEYLILDVCSKGAEMFSLKDQTDQLEYIWNGDPKFWSDRSPLLFPFVGKQKNDRYTINGVYYDMPMHGFAKNCEFELIDHSKTSLVFKLTETENSLRYYPFSFELISEFHLENRMLKIVRKVQNRSDKVMPYCIGEHIGFRIPLFPEENYGDYSLILEYPETAPRYTTKGHLINEPEPFLFNQKEIVLSPHIFDRGALIFKSLRSHAISIQSKNHKNKITVEFSDYKYLGIWAAPGSSFVCIEPWNGIPSNISDEYDIFNKEGIHILQPEEQCCLEVRISIT